MSSHVQKISGTTYPTVSMEQEDCEEENILKHDELVLSHDQKCKNADQDEIITYKHPVKPKVSKAGERNDSSREKARLWRKKRMLNKPTKSKEAGKVHRDVPNPRNVPKFRKGDLYYHFVAYDIIVSMCYF